MKACSKCGVLKELSEFYVRPANRFGFQLACKVCCRKAARTNDLWVKYRLGHGDLERMKWEQGGTCAICKLVPKGKKGFCVDHNHATGEVRALLCSDCNVSVGLLKESVSIAESIVQYLKKHSA